MRTMYFALIFSLITCQSALAKPMNSEDLAERLVSEAVQAMGGVDQFKSLIDVEYTYVYRDRASSSEDVSLERYILNGELSWARYEKHEKFVMPDQKGVVVQAYDGNKTWVTVDGKLVKDPELLKMADFLRKTNYYWFAMMFKLLDPGLLYSYEGKQTVNGIEYEKVKVNFEPGIGDVNDTYVLFVNPSTKLIDRFLFTVMDFGKKEPYLMVVNYEEIDGVKLPARRKYTASTWNGEVIGKHWVDEIMKDIKVRNGLERQLFLAPVG